MGWCADFGCRISDGCDYAMVAGATACTCQACGVRCEGKFRGCAAVWAAGPRAGDAPRLKVAPKSAAPTIEAGPDPQPVIDALGEAVELLRQDVDAVRAGLRDGIDGLRYSVDALDGQARTLGTVVQSLRREVEVVAALLAQQPAMLAAIAEAHATAVADLAREQQAMSTNIAEAQVAVMADLVALRHATAVALAEPPTRTVEAQSPYERLVGNHRARSVAEPVEGRGATGPMSDSRLPPSPLEGYLDLR